MSTRPDFVHLHLHTEFSLLDGAIRHDALMDQVVAHGSRAVGMTDYGNMFGAISFYEEATARGLKPILGCEMYVAPGSRFEKTSGGIGEAAYHLTVLAMNPAGYTNLCRLVTAGYLEGFYYRPRIDMSLLEQHNEGLIALSGCLGAEVPHKLVHNGRSAAMQALERYRGIFGDRYYLEMQKNEVGDQVTVNEGILEISKHTGIPVVATNDCHYLTREDASLHDVLLCIQTNATRDQTNRFRFTGDTFYVRSPEEMAELFSGVPQALASTMEIAERCDLKLVFGQHQFPRFEPPQGKDLDDFVREQARAGLERRLSRIAARAGFRAAELEARYRDRLEYELQVITGMKFSGYFLIVSDFIGYAKSSGIPVGPGRGSAAGSLVAYCLDITDIDPLRYDLLFERFLNPERKSMPDIDVDFCMDRRDEVIRYVTEKYGKDNVAQITTFGTMAAKAAVRDVGRALGFSFGETDRVAKLIPPALGMTIKRALDEEPRLRQAGDQDPRVKELIDTAKGLEGLTRHASTHAAGVVIGSRPLVEDLPLYKGPEGELITQYPMTHVEKIGLIKFDFLGLKTLTVMAQAVERIRENRSIALDLGELALDDEATYHLLTDADTNGVFQLESSGIKDLLRRMKPSTFEDLVALVALYRPGPLESGMVDSYISRKHGLTEIAYDHPGMEEVLRGTYGVIVYQEQVMQIAQRLASFTMGEADGLRKAMGKKKPEEMEKLRAKFVSGSETNGIQGDLAKKIYDDIEKFAGYGFNKSHSAAYALIAYQTAYLKTHFRSEFMAALLTCDMANTDKVTRYIAECRENKIPIAPPDVRESERAFTVRGEQIRVGLGVIKNVGGSAIDSIIAARSGEGGFRSVLHFLRVVDLGKVNRRVVEALIKAGAFDALGVSRGVLWKSLDDLLELAARERRAKETGQLGMFEALGGGNGTTESFRWPSVPDWDQDLRFSYERESLGFYVSGHPLEKHRAAIQQLATCSIEDLVNRANDESVAIVGLVTGKKEKLTKKGSRMAFLNVEDLTGSVEVIAFPEVLASAQGILEADEPIFIRGTVDVAEGGAKVIAEEVRCLAEAKGIGQVHVALDGDRLPNGGLQSLQTLFQANPGGCKVVLHVVRRGICETVLELPKRAASVPPRD
ncbi:MAG: DNA polymerase III subunit alpha [Deltaproteobacteria bacterium]|nr:DNA polymerase III subunit alpha [Deltaproteobacteria bacterium]